MVVLSLSLSFTLSSSLSERFTCLARNSLPLIFLFPFFLTDTFAFSDHGEHGSGLPTRLRLVTLPHRWHAYFHASRPMNPFFCDWLQLRKLIGRHVEYSESRHGNAIDSTRLSLFDLTGEFVANSAQDYDSIITLSCQSSKSLSSRISVYRKRFLFYHRFRGT